MDASVSRGRPDGRQSETYKGHLIEYRPRDAMFYVSREGVHIGAHQSRDYARRAIDRATAAGATLYSQDGTILRAR